MVGSLAVCRGRLHVLAAAFVLQASVLPAAAAESSARSLVLNTLETRADLRSAACNIDRRPQISNEEFSMLYKNKKPVVLGSSLHAPQFTGDELQAYLTSVGDSAIALTSPYARPNVGLHFASVSDFLRTFPTAGSGSNGTLGAYAEYADLVATHTSHSSSVASLPSPPLLSEALLSQRYRHNNLELHKQLQAAKGSAGKAGAKPPSLASPALCEAYGMSTSDPWACDCAVSGVSLGYTGAGTPFKWGTAVSGTEQLLGYQRWFISRHVPPGGFNPRETSASWAQKVYPAAVQRARALLNNSMTKQPDMYECTLGPGEIMYVPDGWYTSSLNVRASGLSSPSSGSAIHLSIQYVCDANGTAKEMTEASEAIVELSEKEMMPGWRPMDLPLSPAATGEQGEEARLRFLREHYEEDPFGQKWIGKPSGAVSKKQLAAVSLKAKAALMEAIPLIDNYFVNGPASLDELQIEPELARLLEAATVIHPAEPEFLHITSRYALKQAKAWIRENIIQPAQERAEAAQRQQSEGEGAPAIPALKAACEVEDTTLLGCSSSRMASSAVNRVEHAAKVNPLSADLFATLAMALHVQVGEAGWPVKPLLKDISGEGGKGAKDAKDRITPYAISEVGYHLLDAGLAAARRSMELDPLSPGTCMVAANLIAAGAVDRYRYTGKGALTHRHAVHLAAGIALPSSSNGKLIPLLADIPGTVEHVQGSSEYSSDWMRYRGKDGADAGRVQRYAAQLQACVDTANRLLSVAHSADAMQAALDALSSATQSLSTTASYLTVTHSRWSARGLAQREAEEVLEALRTGEGAQVGVDGFSKLTMQPGIAEELASEAQQPLLPLCVLPTRHSAFASDKVGAALNTAVAQSRAQGRVLTAVEAHEVIQRAQRKEESPKKVTKKAKASPSAAGKAA